tara:strand:- start:26476 stop:26697 length:222 start_codon:yes stop_codon:yes gene_type:complete
MTYDPDNMNSDDASLDARPDWDEVNEGTLLFNNQIIEIKGKYYHEDCVECRHSMENDVDSACKPFILNALGLS